MSAVPPELPSETPLAVLSAVPKEDKETSQIPPSTQTCEVLPATDGELELNTYSRGQNGKTDFKN